MRLHVDRLLFLSIYISHTYKFLSTEKCPLCGKDNDDLFHALTSCIHYYCIRPESFTGIRTRPHTDKLFRSYEMDLVKIICNFVNMVMKRRKILLKGLIHYILIISYNSMSIIFTCVSWALAAQWCLLKTRVRTRLNYRFRMIDKFNCMYAHVTIISIDYGWFLTKYLHVCKSLDYTYNYMSGYVIYSHHTIYSLSYHINA